MTKRKPQMNGRGGFTLIELLVVIAIIGILASVSLIAMVDFRQKALAVRVEQEVASFQKAAAVYFANNQSYPDPLTASNYLEACIVVGGVPQKCCISEGGEGACTYHGYGDLDTLDTSAGQFAASDRAPRWLTYLAERAEAVLGDLLPRLPTEAPTSAGGLFKGIFYECRYASGRCADADIFFSVPKENCSRGTTHGGFSGEGICEQNITAANRAASGSATCGDSTCAEDESCSADCASETHCDDTIDNDEDGYTDNDDDDCETPSESDCGNATDDDGDGYTDCDDADCAVDPACALSEDCSTSSDEDGDGFGQCDDGDCSGWSSGYSWSSEVSYTYQYCSAGSIQYGSGSGSCADSSDNDSDGCADGADADCGGGESCGDGVDNNCNGSVDEDCTVPSEDCWNWSDDDGDGNTDGCDSECAPGDNGYCA